MERLTVSGDVRIEGRSFSGRRASVLLKPVANYGWWWEVCGHRVQLGPEMLRLGLHHMYLEYGPSRMYICEHLLALKALAGLDGICVVMETPGLPFDGGAGIFWRRIEWYLKPDGRLEPYEPSVAVHSKKRPLGRTNAVREVTYHPNYPSGTEKLNIEVTSFYPGMKIFTSRFSFPGDLEKVIEAKGMGRGGLRQRVARVATRARWPHYGHFVWPNGLSEQELLIRDNMHRAVDAAGDLALLAPPGTRLVGGILSRCAGHADDFGLVQNILSERQLASVA